MTDEEIDALFAEAERYCAKRRAYLAEVWNLDDGCRWNADLAKGTIRFELGDGRALYGAVSIIGTLKEGIWQWGWANASLPEALRAGSRFMRDFAERTGLTIFAEPAWRCSDAQADGIAELACHAMDGDTPFRMPSRGALIHCVITTLAAAESGASDENGAALPRT